MRSSDGIQLTCGVAGQGPPLLMPGLWFHDVAQDAESPLWKHWLEAATAAHTLHRADPRGRNEGETRWSFELLVEDLAALGEMAAETPADILAFSNTAPIAIAYAVRHPERVRRLAIVGGYAQGVYQRGDPQERAVRQSAVAMGRQMMARDPAAFGRMLAALVIPHRDEVVESWAAERFGNPLFLVEEAQQCFGEIDVVELLPRMSAPTLLLHSRGDRVSPFAGAELMAERLPAARLVPLGSENHILTADEPAWTQARAELMAFLSP